MIYIMISRKVNENTKVLLIDCLRMYSCYKCFCVMYYKIYITDFDLILAGF